MTQSHGSLTAHGADLSRRSSIAVLLGGLIAGASRPALSAEAVGWASVAALADRLIADRVTPGLSISVMRGGERVYSSGFGLGNIETATRVTPETVFRIGSITKQFTASALMLLQEDGKLSVDDRLAAHLPDFPRAKDITLRQMLNHTSGLGDYTSNLPEDQTWQNFRLDRDPKALRKLMEGTDPLFLSDPGTKWAYSNTAYVLLGFVIEQVTGQPYADIFKRRLFEPAGLTDTAVDDAAEIVSHRASGYTPREKTQGQFENAGFISMTAPGAAGSLRSTADDLCRWHKALFGGKVVKPDSLAEMIKPGRLKSGELPPAPPGASSDEAALREYGFGLYAMHRDGRTSVGHSGGINGFRSEVRTLPAEKLTYAVLVNIDEGKGLGNGLRALSGAIVKAGLGLS